MPAPNADEDLLHALALGGRQRDEAVTELYRRHAPALLRFFVHQGASADDARDLLQETVVKVVRGAAGFDGRGAARAWIWQVARHALLDFARRRGRLAEREVALDEDAWTDLCDRTPAAPAGPACSTVEDCVSTGLEVFAREMPERAWALTLQMEGLRAEAIAERIGRSVAATREYLSQCRRKLQPFVAHCVDLLE
jgi:RNA polymerase sigma-70 factor (ECF subfamily)